MKLVIDERVKHRLIGLAVILSIGAIFAPAIMKKSNQRIDGNVSVSVELPPKPAQPDIAMTEKKAMFETVKVAHVEIPEDPEEQPLSTLAKAEPLSQMNESKSKSGESVALKVAKVQTVPNLVKENQSAAKENTDRTIATTKVAAVKKIAKAALPPTPKPKPKVIAKNTRAIKPVAKRVAKNGYGVQLATFSKQRNADSLISKLRRKGFTATYYKITTREGTVYKVIVGQVTKKEQAQILRKQLASSMQIRGFIVTTGQG